MKLQKTITFTIILSMLIPVNAFANVPTMQEVSEKMLDPDHWVEDSEEADELLADRDEIERLNESFLSCEDCNMNDLDSFDAAFDGESANLGRWKSTMTGLAGYLDGKHYDSSGNIITGRYVDRILQNLDDPGAIKEQDTQYGICVRRSDVRAYPTELIIADDPGDNDFDNVQISGIRVGEPVIVRGGSTDGRYYYCFTSCVSGWIPADDIAICRSRDEWLRAWHFPEDKTLVVTSSKIYLEQSNTSPGLSQMMLTMGTVLERIEPYECEETITNRSSYYNYPVWIPARDESGMYEREQALVSAHNGISEGFLPLTGRNILTQAYEMLGDTYGWGGMLSSADCSGYIRDVYKCFGFELPRNTTWQSAMPVLKYDLSVAEDEDKKELFNELPPGTILFFKGHEMLYLGHEGDNYYVISSSSSLMDQDSGEKVRVRSVIINSLDDTKRANGNTWMEDLYEAAVPYIENAENISIPVFSLKEETASDETPAEAESPDSVEEETVSPEGPYEEISFDASWEYAENAKITEGTARLYRSDAEVRKNRTICINAGHGTEGGTEVKTLCHPDGSPKVVTGSTEAGATEATAVSAGTVMKNGDVEAKATLKAAMVVKEELLKAGYDVLMIREEDDVALDNIARALIADNYADAHISIHYDSTDTDKGVFYLSVPNDEAYREMEPVKSHWKMHEMLGKSLIFGLQNAGFPIWDTGALPMDLTQTSYSTIPSVDLELGDTVSDYSYATLVKVAEGITEGLDYFYGSAE
ncbi:MAG: SH3 domain-containing protein [Lachnospiraceae bacterium]|nr:SH3 domain-containing protein [Lachnospiraceae bacterium]